MGKNKKVAMTLHELNELSTEQLRDELSKCCGSSRWVNKMLPLFPMDDLVELLEDAEEKWYECSEADWKEAFSHHPKIGERAAGWAAGEQSGMQKASKDTVDALLNGNKLYEEKFGYIFIVCATGKSAEEMLGLLHARLPNAPEEEINIAADEQNKITRLRLQKLLNA